MKGKAGLQYVTFKQVKRFEFRIGPDMGVSYGAKTRFDGDIVHAKGGNNKQVKLPLHIDQLNTLPGNMIHAAFANSKNWPMVWKKCNYHKRDFLSNPRRVTQKQFPQIFANLNVKG